MSYQGIEKVVSFESRGSDLLSNNITAWIAQQSCVIQIVSVQFLAATQSHPYDRESMEIVYTAFIVYREN